MSPPMSVSRCSLGIFQRSLDVIHITAIARIVIGYIGGLRYKPAGKLRVNKSSKRFVGEVRYGPTFPETFSCGGKARLCPATIAGESRLAKHRGYAQNGWSRDSECNRLL